MSAQVLIAIGGALLLFAAGLTITIVLHRSIRRREERERTDRESRAQEQRLNMQDTLENLLGAQQSLSERVDGLIAESQAANVALRDGVQTRLQEVSAGVETKLSDQALQTTESLGLLSQRLAVIDEAQKNIVELSGQVGDLQDVLAQKHAHGAFGEVQMTDIIRSALPPSAYAFHAKLSNNRRADCLVKLPQPPGSIVVDARFPLESYAELHAAKGTELEPKAERNFKKAVLQHIVDLAERYIVPGETADSALMFMPSEAAYAELHAHYPDIIQDSYRARVWIVSPTTLMATLNTVRAVLKDTMLREQAGLIQGEAAQLINDVKSLRDRVGDLQQHFGQTQRNVSDIISSTDSLIQKGERIEEIRLTSEAADALRAPTSTDLTAQTHQPEPDHGSGSPDGEGGGDDGGDGGGLIPPGPPAYLR